MKKKYFNPNWQAINKAIPADELRKEMRKELYDLRIAIEKKCDEHYIMMQQKKKQDEINELKKLSNGCVVFYTGRSSDISFGQQGTKVKDGRTRMVIEIDGKKWNCYYEALSTTEPTKDQRTSRIVKNVITSMLNNQ